MRGRQCTFEHRGVRCEQRAGRRYGGFNGWCRRHAPKDAARIVKAAKFVGEAAAAAAVGEGVLKLIELLRPFLPRFRRLEPLTSLQEIEQGTVIGGGILRSLLVQAIHDGDPNTLELGLELAERWWDAVPADRRRRAVKARAAPRVRRSRATRTKRS